MFKILNDEKATTDEMAKSFVEIENHITGLQQEKETVHNSLVEAKRENMAGASNQKTLTKFKNQHDDLDLEIEASGTALTEIKSRMIARIPGEVETKIQKLTGHAAKIQTEQEEKKRDFLTLMARAAVVYEEIHGDGGRGTNPPSLRWDQTALPGDDLNFFHEQGEKFQAESKIKSYSESLTGRQSDVQKKLDRLQNITDPAEATDRIIQEARQ